MQTFVYFILGLIVAGAGLALYEWRKGRKLLAHDLNLDSAPQTEADRQAIRSVHEPHGTQGHSL